MRRERVQAPEQRRQRAGLAGVASVPREILGHEHELGRAALDERAGFLFDRLRRARTLLPSERRDRAEGARAVASLGHLDVRPRGGRGGARQLEQVAHAGRLALQDHLCEPAFAAEADDGVRLGQRRRELVAVALGEAARDNHLAVLG